MIIRVTEGTLPQAGAIHAEAWQASHRAFCAAEFVALHTAARQEEYLRGKMAAGAEVYMLIEGEPVGVVSVTGDLIEDLYVLPGKQNRGYGTRLLRYAMERCAGTPTLWILENNTDAERLYRRNGFAPTGRRNGITEKLNEIEFAYRAE